MDHRDRSLRLATPRMARRERLPRVRYRPAPPLSPVAGAVYRFILLAAIAVWLLAGYILVHRDPGWPWEHHALLQSSVTLPVHRSSTAPQRNLAVIVAALLALGIGLYAIWTIVEIVRRPRGGRESFWKSIYPYALLGLMGGLLLSNIHQDDTLRLTADGIWFEWGLVPWNRIQTYHWDRNMAAYVDGAPERPTGNDNLTLRLSDSFPYPRTLVWGISSSEAGKIDHVLQRYLPGRGTDTPSVR
jgi:hypothetical protein